MQWMQDRSQTNADIINNLRPDANRHSRNKMIEQLKANIEELETNSKMKNILYLYRPVKALISYYSRMNVAKNEKFGLVTDSHNILAK
jgi:hypothetical protein